MEIVNIELYAEEREIESEFVELLYKIIDPKTGTDLLMIDLILISKLIKTNYNFCCKYII